jgi:uncharacterized repeat protein (TIGR01451 family)
MVTVAPLQAEAAPASADLSLTMIANPTSAGVGDTVTFTLTAHNAGPDGSTGTTVTDYFNVGLSQLSNTCGATVLGNKVTWNIGSLPANATVTCNLSLQVTIPVNIITLDSISSAVSDPTLNNNQTSVTVEVGSVGVPTLGGAGLAALGAALATLGFFLVKRSA